MNGMEQLRALFNTMEKLFPNRYVNLELSVHRHTIGPPKPCPTEASYRFYIEGVCDVEASTIPDLILQSKVTIKQKTHRECANVSEVLEAMASW